MSSILSRLRSEDNSQGIRQSTALTTVYLLEMNRKFESFMRGKVEELEGRVAAQQARLSTRAEVVEEAWEDTVIEAETPPADELDWTEVVPILDESPQPAPALAVTEMTASSDRDAPDINMPAPPAAIPDYLTLLLGEPARSEPEATAEPGSASVGQEELADSEVEFDDALDDPADEPEDAPATALEAADEGYSEDDGDDLAGAWPTAEPAMASDQDNQPVDAGISALELLDEAIDETIPWFDEESGDFEEIDDEPSDPDRSPEIDPAENDAWDTALPAAGQKGPWG
jgi:hypothetical protein